jgi:hypothetical protein
MKRKRLIVLVLVLVGGTLLFVIFDKPPVLPAVMILPPGPLVVKSGRVPDRWIPAKWGWLHRVCEFFLGNPRQVGMAVKCIETSERVASIVARLSLGQPQAESNGVCVWILPEGTLRPLQGGSTISSIDSRANGRSSFFRPEHPLPPPSRPAASGAGSGSTMVSMARVITGDQSQAAVSVVDTSAFHSADLYARLAQETVDLSTRLVVTTNGQTNFITAMRAQLPYGQALFVLDVRQPESATNRMGFVITADEYDAKGNIVHRKSGGK